MTSEERKMISGQILTAIEYGNLPREEIERRLHQIIEEELAAGSDRQLNMNKVDLCTSLLWQLSTHGEIDFEDHAEASQRNVMRRYQKRESRRRLLRWSLRVAAIALLAFVGLSAVRLLPPVQWLSGDSTDSGQQYVLVGHEISFKQAAQAIENHQAEGQLSTNDLSEVIAYIGFDPCFPSALDDRLFSSAYYVIMTDYCIRISCIYKPVDHEDVDAQIILRLSIYTDMEMVYLPYEQDSPGTSLTILGRNIYRYENAGKASYLWTEGICVYRIAFSGQINDEIGCVERVIETEGSL